MSRHLEDWLKAYLQYTSFNEAPDHFNFWSGVGAIAGALRRKVYFEQEFYRWSPNFYIMIVGPSAIATKSTAMNTAMAFLKEMKHIHIGPNTLTWQALLPELAQAQEQVPMPDGEYETQSCITFASSELGTLLDPSDKRMVDVLVDLWDGRDDAWRKATVTMDDYTAINPWLNIIACTTPAWIADNMSRQMIGGGLTSRFVHVFGDTKKRLNAYPKKIIAAERGMPWLKKLKSDLQHDLEAISTLAGEFELTPEAEALGTFWYEENYRNPSQRLLAAGFDGYIGRKQGHIHKLAMVLSASYKDDLLITEQDLTRAIALMNEIEDSMPKVFRHIQSDSIGARIEDIIHLVRVQKRPLPRNVLYKMVFTKMSMPKQEFDNAVNSAIDAGVLKQEQKGTVMFLSILESSDTQNQSDDTGDKTVSPVASLARAAGDL